MWAALATILLASAAPPDRVTILHTNDWQSSLTGTGPDGAFTPETTGDDPTLGGVARLATLIDRLRTERSKAGPVLLLDGGDVTMGTLYHTVTRETGSELRLMKVLGYDAVTLGNHEFDFRLNGFGQMIASARKEGLPPIVASNIGLEREHPDLEVMRKLYADGVIEKTRIVERDGLRVGFAGVLGVAANEVMEHDTPIHVLPLVSSTKQVVERLRGEGVDLVVVLSHSGVKKVGDGWGGEEVELMRGVPGIDVIVGGHSHTALPEPILVDGRPIVQAGSDTQWLGELALVRDGERWRVERYELHTIDDAILGRADVTARIDDVKREVDARILAPLGYRFDQVVGEVTKRHGRGFDEHVIGNLVTDAMRKATGADIAVTGTGTLRADLKPGELQVSDVFRVSGLGVGTLDDTAGFPLVKLYVDGPSLKSVLEFLLVGYTIKGGDYYPRFSGLRVHYNPWRVPFDRIREVELVRDDGSTSVVDLADPNTRVTIGTTTYIAEFFPIVSELSYGLLDAQILDAHDEVLSVDDLTGVLVDGSTVAGVQELKDWRALVDYVASRPDTDGDGVPNVPETGDAAAPRLLAEPSFAPAALFATATWRMWTATLVVALLGLVVVLVIRRVLRASTRRSG
ncbi:MAG: bifunctional UDP-sugar hydrolase/5'-nucleotidase [Deltaproteobacteria bacterium]